MREIRHCTYLLNGEVGEILGKFFDVLKLNAFCQVGKVKGFKVHTILVKKYVIPRDKRKSRVGCSPAVYMRFSCGFCHVEGFLQRLI